MHMYARSKVVTHLNFVKENAGAGMKKRKTSKLKKDQIIS